MNSLKYVFSAAGLVLAIALVFSCSSGGGGGGDSNNEFAFCVYKDLEQCVAGSYSSCPAGGQPRNSCPKNYELFESDGTGSAYCVYADGCLEGPFSSCIKDGELSNTCPHDNLAGGDGDKPGPGGEGGANACPVSGSGGPVSTYGKLQASGNKLVGSKTGATAVQVRGVSLGWSTTNWESADFFNAATVNAMVDGWKAQIIRVPYGQYNAANIARVKTAVEAAIKKDVYVIIDFHSHDARKDFAAATTFFEEMAKTYGKCNHVIFEVYNEPLDVAWSYIRDYANDIMGTIRTYSDNLVLIGTPNWDSDIDAILPTPGITRSNVAYVFHFYAASHPLDPVYTWDKDFRGKIERVLGATGGGYPVFASEYGTTHADGGCSPIVSNCENGNQYGSHSAGAANDWHTFMDDNKISSVAWNVNDKYEGSAFFGTSSTGRFTQSAANFTNENMMTSSGKYIYKKLKDYAGSGGTPGDGSGLYCDYGPKTSCGNIYDCEHGYNGGCFPVASASDCVAPYGVPTTSCSSGDPVCNYGEPIYKQTAGYAYNSSSDYTYYEAGASYDRGCWKGACGGMYGTTIYGDCPASTMGNNYSWY